jgi:hypothetical protein
MRDKIMVKGKTVIRVKRFNERVFLRASQKNLSAKTSLNTSRPTHGLLKIPLKIL